MEICSLCGKLKSGAETCIDYMIDIKGAFFGPIRYDTGRPNPFRPEDSEKRCPDCNIKPGGYHHVGCSMEICPSCGGRWISCRCQGLKVRIPEKNKKPEPVASECYDKKNNVIDFKTVMENDKRKR